MRQQQEFFAAGQWRPASGPDTHVVVNPATEQPYARVKGCGPADVDVAVAAAKHAFDRGPWRRMPLGERCELILALRDALVADTEQIALETTSTLGLPLQQARGLGASPALIDMYVASINALDLEYLRADPAGNALVTRAPVGVVAGITPWNTPLRAEVKKAIPALLAGCSVVLKPAPETPFGAIALVRAATAAGLPDGVLNVVFGGAATGEALVRHPDVQKVTFTGSTAAGRLIGRICGESLKGVELELGGKSAAIVLDDADLDSTVGWLDRGNFGVSGQVCVGLTRVLASRARYREIGEALAARAAAHRVGDPFDPATTMGPLVSQAQRSRVLDYVAAGRAEGATTLVGGGTPESLKAGWFVEPTVFTDVDNAMTIAQEEIFGPVVSVIPYDSEAAAISIANASSYGLHGAVFSSDARHALALARQLDTGTVAINRFGPVPSAPFGGTKSSGIGREQGPEGFDAFLEYVSYSIPPETFADLRQQGVRVR